MKCPFCRENLIEGDFKCPNCQKLVIDFDYPENMNKIEEKYSKDDLLELSKEKLTFEEIITIYTYIERANHHFGDSEFSEELSQDGTLANISKRLKEIKNSNESY